MVSTTEDLRDRPRSTTRAALPVIVLLGCVAIVAALALTGCGGGTAANPGPTPGAQMSGAAGNGTVVVTRAALESTPEAWDLTSPKAAVRSYLAWTSYSYRIGDSDVSSPTMTADEGVRIDSYIQLNLQKSKLIDQSLTSITFGKTSVEGTHTLLPTKETWEYSYVSTVTAGKVLGGPFPASYDATYTVVEQGKGHWVVDSVVATAKGTLK